MSDENMEFYSDSDTSDIESGRATPVLVAGTSINGISEEAIAEDDDFYVVPSACESKDNLNMSCLDISVHEDNDVNKLSEEMSAMCKQMVKASTSYLANYKIEATLEKEKIVRELETKYCVDMQLQEERVENLNKEIISLKTKHADEVMKLERASESVTTFLAKKLDNMTGMLAKQKSFHSWTASTKESKRMNNLEHMAIKFHQRRILATVFISIQRDAKKRMYNRITKEGHHNMDTATQRVITEYETKLQKLTAELEEMHTLLHVETENRKQFEEQLKRVFLKNLTHMNMEAYALFNTNNDINNSLDAMVDSVASHSVIRSLGLNGTSDMLAGSGGGSQVESPSVVKRPPQPPPSTTESAITSDAPRVVVTKHNTPVTALRPHVTIASTSRSARVESGGRVNKNPPNSVLRKSIRPNTIINTHKSVTNTSANTMRTSMENVVPRANAPPLPMHYPFAK